MLDLIFPLVASAMLQTPLLDSRSALVDEIHDAFQRLDLVLHHLESGEAPEQESMHREAIPIFFPILASQQVQLLAQWIQKGMQFNETLQSIPNSVQAMQFLERQAPPEALEVARALESVCTAFRAFDHNAPQSPEKVIAFVRYLRGNQSFDPLLWPCSRWIPSLCLPQQVKLLRAWHRVGFFLQSIQDEPRNKVALFLVGFGTHFDFRGIRFLLPEWMLQTMCH